MIRKPSQKTLEENTTVVKKKGSDETTVKKGIALPSENKAIMKLTPIELPRVVGVSKGITKNMGDYQSLRIDCWLSDEVQQGESIEEAIDRLSNIIDGQLTFMVEKTIAEEADEYIETSKTPRRSRK